MTEKKETIYIASDHAGFGLKQHLIQVMKNMDLDPQDLGTKSEDSVDYPDYADKLAEKVIETDKRGIGICGTGIGISIALNRHKGIRAALVYNDYTAEMSRRHNNANVLCLGGKAMEKADAERFMKIWIETPFSDEERHTKRVDKLDRC